MYIEESVLRADRVDAELIVGAGITKSSLAELALFGDINEIGLYFGPDGVIVRQQYLLADHPPDGLHIWFLRPNIISEFDQRR